MEIMKLIPTGKDYLWGGTRLREEYGKKIDLTPLAETWECSVHPDGPSYVANTKSNRVWPIDVGPRSGGNMIPDLLGDMFGVDIAEMSVKAAMGAAIKGNIHEPNGFYATHNLHSNKNGIYKDILFSPEIEPYIYRKYLYKKLGDEVEYFDNAAKCLGIVFFKFPDETTMKKILEHVNELITVELQ